MGINQSTSPLVRYEPISFTHLLNIKYSVKKAKLVNMLVSVQHGGGVIFFQKGRTIIVLDLCAINIVFRRAYDEHPGIKTFSDFPQLVQSIIS